MSNSWFQFKDFTIHQDRCAMKVSTDACIQAAWTPIEEHVHQVLDIGCGTGLLSLMLANRNSAIHIDAIDLDVDSALQAAENANGSAWAGRINVIQGDVTQYAFDKQYDMVICNPPFFNNSLLGDDDARNNVRHTLTLSYTALFAVIQKVLKSTGYASILLPAAEHDLWAKLVIANGWTITQRLDVYPKHNTDYNRVVSICRPVAQVLQTETLQIHQQGGGYTEAFTQLMQPFYLKL